MLHAAPTTNSTADHTWPLLLASSFASTRFLASPPTSSRPPTHGGTSSSPSLHPRRRLAAARTGGKEGDLGARGFKIPCGLAEGSAVTVVWVPKEGVVWFRVEMVGGGDELVVSINVRSCRDLLPGALLLPLLVAGDQQKVRASALKPRNEEKGYP
ncbi:hypothetical protein E2562_005019 [Oryza meyeriana var. granulata]|uniref:Uncharacterized protein n=1 Tax=Oryza meyeriana var. granulata TaxID=110450 RepID=A0A6G1BT62_9ORYZ|nr:hypothetical protein E2562_005019 [Oryza meyeriana var. granulata]